MLMTMSTFYITSSSVK